MSSDYCWQPGGHFVERMLWNLGGIYYNLTAVYGSLISSLRSFRYEYWKNGVFLSPSFLISYLNIVSLYSLIGVLLLFLL